MRNLDQFERRDCIAWRFETARFTVALVIEPEEMDPADSFEFEEDIEAVRSGAVEWFQAGVLVFDEDGEQIGADWHGGCAYRDAEEFYTSHRTAPYESRNTSASKAAGVSYCHYFPSMVSEAVADARRTIDKRRAAYPGVRGIA